MNSSTHYCIEHSWGDIRSPEYCNGIAIAYAYYREGHIRLTFKLIGKAASESDPDNIKWVMVAPENMREMLGSQWNQHQMITDRVTNQSIEKLKKVSIHAKE